jgi:hypothetical protein
MTHQVTITCDASIIKIAVRRFWWRCFRPSIKWALILACSLLLFAVLSTSSWFERLFIGIFTTLGVGTSLLWAANYFACIRGRLRQLRGKPSHSAVMTINETDAEFVSEYGSLKSTWDTLEKMWRFPEAWLLFPDRKSSAFVILPVRDLPLEVQQFLIIQLTRHKCPID